MRSIRFQLLFFVALTGVASGQTTVQLIDKFERMPCSEIRGRSDHFMETIMGDPRSSGYVVVSGVEEQQRFLRRWIIENQLIFRNFPRSRVVYLQRPGAREGATEFWKGDAKGPSPIDAENNWNYIRPKGSKPSLIVTDNYNESECAEPSNEEYLSRFLYANPTSRVNVVIRCNGLGCFNEHRNEVRKGFAEQKVSKNRVRYIYVPIHNMYYAVEYWLWP